MKKSLIALAALAAVGAASAQSSVTLYGVIDTNYGWSRTKQTLETPGPTFTFKKDYVGLNPTGGNLSGSRWGLKGQEDLGNGLSAVFNVEAGFTSNSGEFNAGGFNRRAVVGLKGGFGQVLLGNDYTPMDFIGSSGGFQASDLVTGDGAVSWLDGLPAGEDVGTSLYTVRAQGIHYSGNFNGVGVMAFAGHNETKRDSDVPETRERTTGYGVGVTYASGPFAIGAAVQRFEGESSGARFGWPTPAENSDTESTQYGIGASYDFGVAKLHGHWMANDFEDNVPDTYNKPYNQIGVGVTVPMGAFTLGAQYAYNRWNDAYLNNDAKGHDFVLQGTYALSKRTDLYARVGRYNAGKLNVGPATFKSHQDVAAIGVRHSF